MTVVIRPSRAVAGRLEVPPSKSITHRAILCAALAGGQSHISNLAYSQDAEATLAAAAAFGAQADRRPYGELFLTGAERRAVPAAPVDCGESGSTLRFLIPLAALGREAVTFTGRGRLLERPQSVYEEIFAAQGLRFDRAADHITVAGPLQPGRFDMAGNVSSQFVTGLLLALPLLDGDSTIKLRRPVESRSYIKLTREVQARFGVESYWLDMNTLFVPGGQQYRPCDMVVEGDWSQAAFPAVLGALAGDITVRGLQRKNSQGDSVIARILRLCGLGSKGIPGGFRFFRAGDAVPEGGRVDLADCPDLGPILMVLGLFCEGETVIRNAGRLRLKESDRIAAMEAELRKFGGQIESTENTVTVRGSRLHTPTEDLDGHNDHRVVMSLTVLAAAAGLPATITGAEAVAKSWPDFFDAMRRLGVEVDEYA